MTEAHEQLRDRNRYVKYRRELQEKGSINPPKIEKAHRVFFDRKLVYESDRRHDCLAFLSSHGDYETLMKNGWGFTSHGKLIHGKSDVL